MRILARVVDVCIFTKWRQKNNIHRFKYIFKNVFVYHLTLLLELPYELTLQLNHSKYTCLNWLLTLTHYYYIRRMIAY